MDSLYEPIDGDDDDDVAACGSSAARLAARTGKPGVPSGAGQTNFSLRQKPQFASDGESPTPPVGVPKKLFPANGTYASLKPATWSNGSTSDYESTKDIYDSYSSSSRSSNSANGRSTSPSIVSEAASESQTSDSGYIETTTCNKASTTKPIRHCRTLDHLSGIEHNQPKHHISCPQENQNKFGHQAVNHPAPQAQKKQAPLPPTPKGLMGIGIRSQHKESQGPQGVSTEKPHPVHPSGPLQKSQKPRRFLKPSALFQHYRGHLINSGKESSVLGTVNTESDLSSTSSASETEIYRL